MLDEEVGKLNNTIEDNKNLNDRELAHISNSISLCQDSLTNLQNQVISILNDIQGGIISTSAGASYAYNSAAGSVICSDATPIIDTCDDIIVS